MLLIGHSHMDIVYDASLDRGDPAERIHLWLVKDPVTGEPGERRLADDIAARLNGPVCSLIGGAAHFILSLNAHPQPFDFILPENPDLPLIEGAQLIPYEEIRHALIDIAAPHIEMMRHVARSAAGQVFHVMPPPALWEEEMIDHPLWVQRTGGGVAVSPPWLRQKAWRTHQEIMLEVCEEEGIVAVPPPDGVTDSRGFLLPEFAGHPAHANKAYGDLVYRQLKALGL